nr:MAG TPA: hypothetical protein [Caudoviricetes sp.]
MMLTNILGNFMLNNSTTQQLNNSTTQQLNNSTTQQLRRYNRIL